MTGRQKKDIPYFLKYGISGFKKFSFPSSTFEKDFLLQMDFTWEGGVHLINIPPGIILL